MWERLVVHLSYENKKAERQTGIAKGGEIQRGTWDRP